MVIEAAPHYEYKAIRIDPHHSLFKLMTRNDSGRWVTCFKGVSVDFIKEYLDGNIFDVQCEDMGDFTGPNTPNANPYSGLLADHPRLKGVL